MVKTVHTLKVTLREVQPAVWRRVSVPSETRLDELGAIVEAAMGWEGIHLHQFEVDGITYGDLDDDDFDDEMKDEREATVAEVLPAVGSRLRFDYDFGDGWEHDVVVEGIYPRNANVRYPTVLAGERACPPEDCGGPRGYASLLDALADPANAEHDEALEWLDDDFDPAAFDLNEADAAVRGW
jgi:hypothetical protein